MTDFFGMNDARNWPLRSLASTGFRAHRVRSAALQRIIFCCGLLFVSGETQDAGDDFFFSVVEAPR